MIDDEIVYDDFKPDSETESNPAENLFLATIEFLRISQMYEYESDPDWWALRLLLIKN